MITRRSIIAAPFVIIPGMALAQRRWGKFQDFGSGSAPVTGTAPTIDGFVSGINLDPTGLTTTQTNDIIVIMAMIERPSGGAAGTITGYTGTGGLNLTWSNLDSNSNAMRYNGVPTGGGAALDIEFWWAFATTTIAPTDTTLATTSGTLGSLNSIMSGWHGCGNTSAPWDTNVSLPKTGNDGNPATVPSTSGISTTAPGTVILSAAAASRPSATYTPQTATTLITNEKNDTGANFTIIAGKYLPETTAQTSISDTFDLSWENWGMLTHALIGT